MPSSDKAIEIQKLNLQLGQRIILDSISFEVNSGTILGILGRSGSGKTSLFRAILGVPTTTNLEQSGSIYFFGKARQEIPIHHLQPVFQDPVGSFNPAWSLEKALKEPLRILGGEIANRGEAFFPDLLESFRLANKDLNRNVLSFSGGELQRAAILRALLTEPKILFLDEALGALDPILLNDVLQFLKRISRERKITILLITHSLRTAQKFCNQIGILEKGKLLDFGTTEEVFTNYKSSFTGELIRAIDLSSLRA
ncbi:ABC transporter ATP-binding protein [Leptospira interrogans]|uniref:ABC transporter, ATP-binding protein n=1 Tax=Leptospira interrogans str. FPW1039 TaxID=1193040 RepID=A0A0F6IA13_LEPIR|nr:ATP-binding cassette domain-containing protein [Leptospira interrogans]ASV05136.1 ABC transporter ATP-binding protein [Leptospira interrogans serovar Canicola]EKO71240.1 ABC transporter, ATP-binding protein [Leptospira interrogans serovar Canicola str. Fiocruz LV133]EKR33842.1 ABC transporter, ATP-binding protein [Leptospira interrogans serovar Hebdomadis str. R499]EKR84888.1 ABC transporter, ATP-binding protein [Leptospira interrogans str. UI 08452]EMJ34888.1 ABC transporter, ATP-binding p